jgi:hypothetical protein
LLEKSAVANEVVPILQVVVEVVHDRAGEEPVLRDVPGRAGGDALAAAVETEFGLRRIARVEERGRDREDRCE